MKNIQVPDDFIKLASTYSISRVTAGQIFTYKSRSANFNPLGSEELTRLFGYNANTTINKLWKTFLNNQVTAINQDSLPDSALIQNKQTVSGQTYLEQATESLEKLIGSLRTTGFQKSKSTETGRIAVGGDIHGLFADEVAFGKFLLDPAETCILVGDLTDFYSISNHQKTLDYITATEEIADARAKAEALCKNFKKVYYVGGNHDISRARKQINRNFPQLNSLIIDPSDLFFAKLPNAVKLTLDLPKFKNSSKFSQPYSLDSCGLVGDIFVSHLENFFGEDCVKQLDTFINTWENIIDVSPRVIVHGHSHALSQSFTRSGRQLINTGSLCNPMPYQMEHHGKYKPSVPGYAVLYQVDGITDLNRSQLIYLGETN